MRCIQDVVCVELEADPWRLGDEKQAPNISKGGIHLPDPDLHWTDRGGWTGVVVAVGPGKRNKKGVLIPTTLQVGDRVKFNPHEGVRDERDGKQYLFLREPDIHGVYEQETAA